MDSSSLKILLVPKRKSSTRLPRICVRLSYFSYWLTSSKTLPQSSRISYVEGSSTSFRMTGNKMPLNLLSSFMYFKNSSYRSQRNVLFVREFIRLCTGVSSSLIIESLGLPVVFSECCLTASSCCCSPWMMSS